MVAVSVSGVSKKYRIFPSDRDRLKEALSFGRKNYGHDFWALKEIDLEVEPGTTLGILGRNGAGKSTLLSIISGVLQPTSGTVEVNGRLVALAALGALGFSPDMTGRENILLNGMILGLERREIVEHFDDIAAFADIGEFMDQPVKTYSSGMRSRLGFAVAVNVKPDILVLDETLASGDAEFKERALQKMYELRDSGMTTLFVSHSMSTLEDFCNKAILMHEGRVMSTGETTEIIGQYQDLVSSIRAQKRKQRKDDRQLSDEVLASDENEKPLENSSQNPVPVSGIRARKKGQQTDAGQPSGQVVGPNKEKDSPFKANPDFERRVASLRSGTGEARIQNVELLDERLRPVEAVASGSTVTVRVYLEYLEAVQDSELIISLSEKAAPGEGERQESRFYGPNLGYVLELYERYREDPESVDKQTREFFKTWNPPPVETNGRSPSGVGELFAASTALEGVPLKEEGEQVIVDFTFEVPLRRGRYNISAGVRAGGEDTYLDRVDAATTFRIKRPRNQRASQGIVHLPTQIKVRILKGERQGRSA